MWETKAVRTSNDIARPSIASRVPKPLLRSKKSAMPRGGRVAVALQVAHGGPADGRGQGGCEGTAVRRDFATLVPIPFKPVAGNKVGGCYTHKVIRHNCAPQTT